MGWGEVGKPLVGILAGGIEHIGYLLIQICIFTYSNVFVCIRMHLNASACVRYTCVGQTLAVLVTCVSIPNQRTQQGSDTHKTNCVL